MIVITGAAGHYGKATIDFLLKKGVSPTTIRAFIRDEAKAGDLKAKGIDVKIGDYNDYASMLAAFKGADKLLLISGTDMMNRSKQQADVVKAAVASGVKRIFYTSIDRKNETETSPVAMVTQSHISTENAIKQSGLAYTIIRNNIYFDMLPIFWGDKVLETGIFFPAGDTKFAFALRNDMAEATANALINDGPGNKDYIIANTDNTSFPEIATLLSEITGKKITYTSPDPAVYADALTKAQVPAEYIGVFTAFAEAIKQGEFVSEKTDLEKLLGRKPLAIKEFLKQVIA